jgi:hypothetical protein
MAIYVPPTEREKKNPILPFGDHHDSPFYSMDVLSVLQFGRDDLDYIFGVAKEMCFQGGIAARHCANT